MKNWVVKLLLLLFIPSFVGILFTVILGFNPGGWLQITTYLYLRYSLSPEGLLSLLQDGKFLFLY